MKHFGNALNLLSAAVITATTPVASTAIYRTSMSKAGGGLVRATGAFTGQTDATFDVEVLNDTIVGTPRVSTPAFSGVGNAAMTLQSATGGVAAQSITITLADLGTETRNAYSPFQGATLRAKTSGADANYIELTIDESALVRTATTYSLLAEIVAGTNEYVGSAWDFGGAPRNPDGTIPSNTVRISFGDDPQVYRQFKVFQNGAYVYSFTPAPVRNIPVGTAVKTVTGGRTVSVVHTPGAAAATFIISTVYTLGQLVKPIAPNGHWYEVTVAGTSAAASPTWPTNGATVVSNTVTFIDRGVHTNTYTSIITLYDALTAIHGDADSLIAVDEAIVNDLTFGGMGITDLGVRTGAFVQSVAYSTDQMRRGGISVAVLATAPTEELLLRCTVASPFNAEAWEVHGSVSGVLALAVTGVAYDGTNYDFTIPENIAPEISPTAEISHKLSGAATDCVENAVLGALAQPRTFTFEWQTRVPECGCDGTGVIGGPNPILLGTDPLGGIVESLPAQLKTRAQSLWAWYSTFVDSNTNIAAAATELPIDSTIPLDGPTNHNLIQQIYSATLKVDRIDIAAAKKARDIFYSTLRDMYDHLPGTTPAAAATIWDASFTALQSEFAPLATTNSGAEFWTTAARRIALVGTGGTVANSIPLYKKIFSEIFDDYMERYRAQMEKVLLAADIEPSFDSSTGGGNGPWTDHNGAGWFVATDSPLLPIQPGWYYHSAIRVNNADGTFSYESTQQFGIGLDIGCPANLTNGDKFEVTIGETGTSIRGYQQGDNYKLQIVAGSAVQLGGGQTGNDTQVWSVVGSVDGAQPNYNLYKPTPPQYNAGTTTFIVSTPYALGARVIPIAANGHWYQVTVAGTSAGASPTWPTDGTTVVSGGATFIDLGPYINFLITPGGIDSVLGDVFVWWVEGGQFQWRKNAGAWSAATQIATTVVLSDGVSAAFDPGAAPSFIDGDTYSFAAEAVNGGEHIQSLTYGGIVTTEFLDVVDKHRIQAILTTADNASDCLIVFRDPTEVGATVTVRGYTNSADLEGTEVVTGTGLTNGSRGLLIALLPATTVCQKFTVTYYATANTPATIAWNWLCIGDPLELELRNGNINLGDVTQRWKMPKKSGRSALGAQVEYEGCSQQSVEDLKYLYEYASLNDDGRLAVVVRDSVPAPTRARDAFGAAHTNYPEVGIVVAESEAMEIKDIFEFHPTDRTKSALAVSIEYTPT